MLKIFCGDYIAYEKNGKVVHISLVSGSDSKGYSLVISHNRPLSGALGPGLEQQRGII